MANATFADTRKVWDDVEELSSSEDMLFAYAREHYANLNYNDDLRWAREEGIERGVKQGLQKGLQQKQLDIARSLSQLGVDPTIISQSTGLSLDEISGLS
jgi:predicted transposase/invertase (TIGR01784 family)